MKRLVLAAVLLGCASAPVLLAKPILRTADVDDKVDTVEFWTTTVKLLDKAGYAADSEFGKHARANLQRVETRRANLAAGIGAAATAARETRMRPTVAKEVKKAKTTVKAPKKYTKKEVKKAPAKKKVTTVQKERAKKREARKETRKTKRAERTKKVTTVKKPAVAY